MTKPGICSITDNAPSSMLSLIFTLFKSKTMYWLLYVPEHKNHVIFIHVKSCIKSGKAALNWRAAYTQDLTQSLSNIPELYFSIHGPHSSDLVDFWLATRTRIHAGIDCGTTKSYRLMLNTLLVVCSITKPFPIM